MTSKVDKSYDDLAKFRQKDGEAITLDLFIGEEDFLGKGLAAKMIREFLTKEFGHVSEVFIDPEVDNTKAVHVYEKAGFQKVGEFIAKWHPVPHWIMRLNMDDLR